MALLHARASAFWQPHDFSICNSVITITWIVYRGKYKRKCRQTIKRLMTLLVSLDYIFYHWSLTKRYCVSLCTEINSNRKLHKRNSHWILGGYSHRDEWMCKAKPTPTNAVRVDLIMVFCLCSTCNFLRYFLWRRQKNASPPSLRTHKLNTHTTYSTIKHIRHICILVSTHSTTKTSTRSGPRLWMCQIAYLRHGLNDYRAITRGT